MNQNLILSKIEKMIYVIRGHKVMIDTDLARLYGIETKYLKRSVRRNIKRFPEDFMFELTKEEFINWRCKIGTSNKGKMGLRIPPFVFTEQGVAMLSSIIKSEKAIQVNISIMRIFTKLRSFLLLERNLSDRMDKLERETHKMFRVVFEQLDEHKDIAPALLPRRKKIGLKNNKD